MKVARRPDEPSLTRLIPRYSGRPYSYSEVGATRRDSLPTGYHHVTRSVVLGADEATFHRAAEALMTWSMHRRAGLVVAASAERAAVDGTTVMAFGVALAGVIIPCRVVWTVDEPDRQGFGYGTLPDHPERGEETFVVERVGGQVTLSIRAFSVPGSPLVRTASGVGRQLQAWMTGRYERSLAELARP